MDKIIECVPNFSEGRDKNIIESIVAAIAATNGIKVLNVDSGLAANRTVVTFIGAPDAVCEAAFQAVSIAGELIDMSKHKGEHPRIGATDVLPLVPVSGISLEECSVLARSLAEKIFIRLGIPCYCYEAAAYIIERKNLAVCRAGEYEALEEKISDPKLRPDFSPLSYNTRIARTGATCVGARNFLIAVNFNLNTKDASIAHEIAKDIRESGRKIYKDGDFVRVPGLLKGCKAIGWYIDEYGCAQVSMNITDIEVSPFHLVYDTVCRAALKRGQKVTGTELIGLAPKASLVEAGRYFLLKEGENPRFFKEEELISHAIFKMHLDELRPFDPCSRLI